MKGNHEANGGCVGWWCFGDKADWQARFFVCSKPDGSGCGSRLCTSPTKEGETVTWDYCCNLGTVTTGQYAKVEVWDTDTFTDDDFGGRVMVLLPPHEQGGYVGGQPLVFGVAPNSMRGEHTEGGSSITLTVSSGGWG